MESDEEDDFVSFGTALPPYEKDELPKKTAPFDESAVLDSKGRARRFHGAFTGGFSAGYFNTVGSKEGWRPSTFTSSRAARAADVGSTPEDFMDDEDLGEHGIAPRALATTTLFSEEDRRKRGRAEREVFPGDDVLHSMVVSASQPMGLRLLRRLGWKDGQGVGPRRAPRRAGGVYGPTLPSAGSDSEEDMAPQGATFAPKDCASLVVAAKANVHGLGYRGMTPHSVPPPPPAPRAKPAAQRGGKARGRGQAFGVKDDSGDDDVYSVDSIRNYDIVLEPEKDALHGWTAPSQRGGARTAPAGYGGLLLEGFTPAVTTCAPHPRHAPPTIPHGYCARHVFPTLTQCSEQSSAGDSKQRAQLLGEQPQIRSVSELMSPADAARLAEVKRALSAPAADRGGWVDGSSSSSASTTVPSSRHTPDAVTTQPPIALPTPTETTTSAADTGTSSFRACSLPAPIEGTTGAKAAGTSGFKPFLKDEAKQARFERFQSAMRGSTSTEAAIVAAADTGQTEWERAREREEFSRAHNLYRPLASMMAARFTTAQQEDPLGGAAETTGVQASPAVAAAEMKMFGKMTRSRHEWHPHNTVCKRFNIPNPYPHSEVVGVPGMQRDKYSVFDFLGQPPPTATPEPPLALPPPLAPAKTIGKIKILAHVGKESSVLGKPAAAFLEHADDANKPAVPGDAVMVDDVADEGTLAKEEQADDKGDSADEGDEKGDAADTTERPPMDLFKAIFQSDSSSADDDSDADDPNDGKAGDAKEDNGGDAKEDNVGDNLTEIGAPNSSRSTIAAPASGKLKILAHVGKTRDWSDASATLNTIRPPSPTSIPVIPTMATLSTCPSINIDSEDLPSYGPMPPPCIGELPDAVQKHKHKEKKKKSRHKKSGKKSSHRRDSDSSEKHTDNDRSGKHTDSDSMEQHGDGKAKHKKHKNSSRAQKASSSESDDDSSCTDIQLLNRLKQCDNDRREKHSDNDRREKHSDCREKHSDSTGKHSDSREKHSDSREKHSDSREKHSDSREKHSDSREKHSDYREKHDDSRGKHSDSKKKHSDSREKHSDCREKRSDGREKHSDSREKHHKKHKKSSRPRRSSSSESDGNSSCTDIQLLNRLKQLR